MLSGYCLTIEQLLMAIVNTYKYTNTCMHEQSIKLLVKRQYYNYTVWHKNLMVIKFTVCSILF